MAAHTPTGDDCVFIPANGSLLNDDSTIKLPDYRDWGISFSATLTLTDCHLAFVEIVRKARLIGFEIARRKRPFYKRANVEITLEGDSRKFDKTLSSVKDRLEERLDLQPEFRISVDDTLMPVLRNLVSAQAEFRDCSRKLRRSFLSIEKNFGQNVVEPLKRAMIEKRNPDYATLENRARDHLDDVDQACLVYKDVAMAVCTKVKATEGWRAAEELDIAIERLLEQAKATKWSYGEDEDFFKLHSSMFERADGPRSVIAYLKGILNSAK